MKRGRKRKIDDKKQKEYGNVHHCVGHDLCLSQLRICVWFLKDACLLLCCLCLELWCFTLCLCSDSDGFCLKLCSLKCGLCIDLLGICCSFCFCHKVLLRKRWWKKMKNDEDEEGVFFFFWKKEKEQTWFNLSCWILSCSAFWFACDWTIWYCFSRTDASALAWAVMSENLLTCSAIFSSKILGVSMLRRTKLMPYSRKSRHNAFLTSSWMRWMNTTVSSIPPPDSDGRALVWSVHWKSLDEHCWMTLPISAITRFSIWSTIWPFGNLMRVNSGLDSSKTTRSFTPTGKPSLVRNTAYSSSCSPTFPL